MTSTRFRAAIWVAAVLAPAISVAQIHHPDQVNVWRAMDSTAVTNVSAGQAPAVDQIQPAGSVSTAVRSNLRTARMGDSIWLETALNSRGDLTPAAGEHKKYILVKKKPKHKKIKMEVLKPKMKYKKIKMKVPVKVMKKKKVKGYLVKKEKHHHY